LTQPALRGRCTFKALSSRQEINFKRKFAFPALALAGAMSSMLEGCSIQTGTVKLLQRSVRRERGPLFHLFHLTRFEVEQDFTKQNQRCSTCSICSTSKTVGG
jgi:hypothetical protein